MSLEVELIRPKCSIVLLFAFYVLFCYFLSFFSLSLLLFFFLSPSFLCFLKMDTVLYRAG